MGVRSILTTILVTVSVSVQAQSLMTITPEARIAAGELHDAGMREWYQANFSGAEALIVDAANLSPSADYLLDAAGIYFAQRKFAAASRFLTRAKAAASTNEGETSYIYARILMLEAETLALNGDPKSALGVAQDANGILLAMIKSPPTGAAFMRDQALHHYIKNSQTVADALIKTGNAPLAEDRLRDVRQFARDLGFTIASPANFDLVLARAVIAQGRNLDARDILLDIDASELLNSPVIAANQTGIAVVETLAETLGNDQELDQYLAALRTDFAVERSISPAHHRRIMARIENIVRSAE